MKKLIISALVFAFLTSTPAYATQVPGPDAHEFAILIGLQRLAAEEYLVEHSWRQQPSGDWAKAGHQLRMTEKGGKVTRVQVIK